ncbi:MAG: hypothetical protein K8J08_08585 [Thermoanaerobaculia bacterium]|nr:hypothetical protein [Thermoanaerobaculia bacterium]
MTNPQPLRDGIGYGLLAGLVILLSHGLLFLSQVTLIGAFFPGAIQWLMVIPLAVYWYRRGQRQSMKGLLIFAGVVSLLNAACFGFLMVSMSSMH